MTSKRGRLFPIFSLATLLIGATILTLPWVVAQAGLILGLLFVVFNGYVSAYTGFLIMKNSHGYFSFAKRVQEVLGLWSLIVAHVGSIAVLFVALIAFHIFLAENFYDVVNFILQKSHTEIPVWWTIGVCGGFYAIVLFCLVLIPNPTLLIKFSSFAFVFVISVAVIIIYTGFTPPGGIDISEMKYTNSRFGLTIGVLSMSYFVHNVMNVVFYDENDLGGDDDDTQNQSVTKSKSFRYFIDITAAFSLDVVAYALIGAVGYVGYYHYADPVTGEIKDIPDNYLMIFSSQNYFALVGRILLCVKITICFPVVFRALRSNFLIAIFPWNWLDRGKGSEHYRKQQEKKKQSKEIEGMGSSGGVIGSIDDRLLASAEEGEAIGPSDDDDSKNTAMQSLPLSVGTDKSRERAVRLKEKEMQTREPAFLFFLHIVPTSIVLLFVTTAFAVWYRSVGVILSFGGSFCGLLYVYLLPCVLEMKLLYDRYKSSSPSSSSSSSPSLLYVVCSFTIHSILILYGVAAVVLQFVQ